MTAWYWFYLGAGLIILELVTPGFILMFFGIAAVLVALLMAVLPQSLMGDAAQWILFGVFSIASLLLLRKFVQSVFIGADGKTSSLPDAYIGKSARVIEEITRLVPGKVEFNGSNWKAELSDPDSDPITVNSPVEIVKRDNLTFLVKKK